MAVVTKTQVKYNHSFDRKTKRHTINGVQSVLHCHHYTSLYTQLAIDSGETALLQECARESFFTVLDNYFKNNPDIITIQEKVDIGCQYYSILGLGNMEMHFLGVESGEVELTSSHTDSGWMKKWGTYDRPVNYITAGYIEALFEAVLNLPARSFDVVETQSIVMGADTSIFKVIRR
ncbi:MAG: 4-vinyl reductase [Dehalococcoidales bacterium]|nr:4-vinyl reductase [Dehalococcoidales bacterium]